MGPRRRGGRGAHRGARDGVIMKRQNAHSRGGAGGSGPTTATERPPRTKLIVRATGKRRMPSETGPQKGKAHHGADKRAAELRRASGRLAASPREHAVPGGPSHGAGGRLRRGFFVKP